MRYYEPAVEKINTVLEAGVYQQFLTSAIQRVQLSKAKLLGNKLVHQANESMETAAAPMEDTPPSVAHNTIKHSGMSSGKDDDEGRTTGPHLSMSFIEAVVNPNLGTTTN
ncbi:uncharacterized protein [Primulina eburnea]|uniref:uncharacterized protein isoform X2 n=1 Tax=Primulina eburnea TaxID=1245227 RepID=UPI003C6BDB13